MLYFDNVPDLYHSKFKLSQLSTPYQGIQICLYLTPNMGSSETRRAVNTGVREVMRDQTNVPPEFTSGHIDTGLCTGYPLAGSGRYMHDKLWSAPVKHWISQSIADGRLYDVLCFPMGESQIKISTHQLCGFWDTAYMMMVARLDDLTFPGYGEGIFDRLDWAGDHLEEWRATQVRDSASEDAEVMREKFRGLEQVYQKR